MSCVYRNIQYYEKVTDPLDLSTIEKQILTGHYKTVEAFDADMLKVFRNAEVSYTSQALFLLTNMITVVYNVYHYDIIMMNDNQIIIMNKNHCNSCKYSSIMNK